MIERLARPLVLLASKTLAALKTVRFSLVPACLWHSPKVDHLYDVFEARHLSDLGLVQ
jgi:hypothetical protein